MGRCIVKLADNEYVEWSTVVDAPVSYVLTRDEIKRAVGGPDIEERLNRADERGTSMLAPAITLESLAVCNRAGPKESCLSLEEIRKQYKYKAASS